MFASPVCMRKRVLLRVGLLFLVATGGVAADRPEKTSFAWTLNEAQRELTINHGDPYLQYITLQLAENAGQREEYENRLRWSRRFTEGNRREDIGLFSIFTGALAVQESLQLDTMVNRGQPDAASQEHIPLSELSAPTIKAHPWDEMLGDRDPQVSALSKCVPEDFYFVRFRSVAKLTELADEGDLWATHLLDQATNEARGSNFSGRLKQQLAIETNSLLRPFYDLAVSEVAMTGSDLYCREGSDVTLLFGVRQRLLFDQRMQGFLKNAQENNSDCERKEGEYRGVKYVHLATPDRRVSVIAADPREDLHIRSNSLIAFERVVDAMNGETVSGRPAPALGNSTEFKYIRTLFPLDADEEDGFAYLSDPFIRRMVGPEVKILELRRMEAYNHLRMIGHAQLLHRTQYGKPANSLDELLLHECLSFKVNQKEGFASPGEVGEYALSTRTKQPVNSYYGNVDFLRPIIEVPFTYATREEAEMYEQFRERYDQYWRTFFDPIAIRIHADEQQYRLETLVLPLMDNSIYSSMAMAMQSDGVKAMDAYPVPNSNILSVYFNVPVEKWSAELLREIPEEGNFGDASLDEFFDPREAKKVITRFVKDGIGDQVGLHVCDSKPLFDMNMPALLGMLAGRPGGGRSMMNSPEFLLAPFLISSINSPVYVSVPVRDIEATDKFLDLIENALAVYARADHGRSWFRVEPDFYRLKQAGGEDIRCQSFKVGPIKWRMFWTRIDNVIYVASKRETFDDIRQAHVEQGDKKRADVGPTGHAVVRMRAENWDKVLPDFQLSWAENNRVASLNNISPLYGVARAILSEQTKADKPLGQMDFAAISKQAHAEAMQIYGVDYYCPDGGKFELASDGKSMHNSLHGTPLAPMQNSLPAENVTTGRLLSRVRQVTAALTFEKEGLRAVLIIDRQEKSR
ncbi:MAG: hypothetical protein R3C01_09625 [Planctomycetaceae bacterium]